MLGSGQQNPDVLTGINVIEQFGSDDFTPQLIAIANDPGNIGRNSAIDALAMNRTDAGVAALNTLLNDPDLKVRDWAERAIRAAYTSRDNVRGRPLKPDDFDAKYQAPEPGK